MILMATEDFLFLICDWTTRSEPRLCLRDRTVVTSGTFDTNDNLCGLIFIAEPLSEVLSDMLEEWNLDSENSAESLSEVSNEIRDISIIALICGAARVALVTACQDPLITRPSLRIPRGSRLLFEVLNGDTAPVEVLSGDTATFEVLSGDTSTIEVLYGFTETIEVLYGFTATIEVLSGDTVPASHELLGTLRELEGDTSVLTEKWPLLDTTAGWSKDVIQTLRLEVDPILIPFSAAFTLPPERAKEGLLKLVLFWIP